MARKRFMTYQEAGLTFRQYNEMVDRIASFIKLTCHTVNYPIMRPENVIGYWMKSVHLPAWIMDKMSDERFVTLLKAVVEEKKMKPEANHVIPGYCEFKW